jgi:RNA polymerase sigma-70 factor (ECF subfamily)
MNSLQAVDIAPLNRLVGCRSQDGVNLISVPDSANLKPVAKLPSKRLTKHMESEKITELEAPDNSQAMIALMQQVADQRDRAAFMQIFKHFAPRVKSFLVGRGLNQDTADGVLQEAMLAVWVKAGSYDPAKAGVSTWIFTIARYKYIDRMRRDGRRKTESDEPDLRASDTPVSEDEVLEIQRKDAVQAAIANLPEDQQSVIFLSFIKGLAHSEIAQQLGLPLGTVKSRIRRAFGQLREELGEVM